MNAVFSGGLWSVFLFFGVSAGYIWALNGPKWGYKILLLLALMVILGSQLLPAGHVFRVRIAEGLNWWFWAVIIAIPVVLYGWWVRWLKRKVEQRDDP